jgi:hypothetical protein
MLIDVWKEIREMNEQDHQDLPTDRLSGIEGSLLDLKANLENRIAELERRIEELEKQQ